MRIYRSKIDRWLLALVLLSGAIPGLALIYAFVTEPAVWRDAWYVLPLLAVGYAGVAWVFLSTRYELDDRELRVRSGPFRWRVPLGSLETVRPTRNPLSSPALSLDRLELKYGGGRTLLISPAERDRFLTDLAHRAPQAGGHRA